ncbi:hypothetical protein D3C80_2072090 [compost metagenome]
MPGVGQLQCGAAQAQLVALGRELHGCAAQRLIARRIGGRGKFDVQALGLHRCASQIGKLRQPAGKQ